jgi:hypothetical protein
MESSTLTFAALDKRIEEQPEHPSYQIAPNRRAIWGNGIGFVSAMLALTISKTLPDNRWALATIIVLLVIELTAFILAWTAQLPGLNLRPSKERREFAEILDFDMPHHEELIAWLKSFPRERLQAMSDFASLRVDRLRSKLPILTGGLDKLGALPILAALIIQFKDMHWPPQPSWTELFLFVVLMLVYWLSMLQVGLRFRLELYDVLLKKALGT